MNDLTQGIIGIVLILLIFFFSLLTIDKIRFRKLQKNYDGKEDKSRRTGSQFRGRGGLANSNFERSRMATSTTSDVGKDSSGSRKKKQDARRRRFG